MSHAGASLRQYYSALRVTKSCTKLETEGRISENGKHGSRSVIVRTFATFGYTYHCAADWRSDCRMHQPDAATLWHITNAVRSKLPFLSNTDCSDRKSSSEPYAIAIPLWIASHQ